MPSHSNVTLSLTPSVFNISAIGYGEILLHATSIKGEDFTNLSLQNNDQRIVTANASTPGSNSAWFIEPTEESVDEDFSPVFYKDNPIVGRMKVKTLIEAIPGCGKVKTVKIMEELKIAENRRVQGLGTRQIDGLLERLG